jgi:hypothetical protein
MGFLPLIAAVASVAVSELQKRKAAKADKKAQAAQAAHDAQVLTKWGTNDPAQVALLKAKKREDLAKAAGAPLPGQTAGPGINWPLIAVAGGLVYLFVRSRKGGR